MNREASQWRIAFFVAVGIGVAGVLVLGYAMLNQWVTIAYMSEGYAATEKDLERLARVFPRKAHTKKDVLFLLRKNNPESFIVEGECTVQLDGLRFEFDGSGRLVNINTKAESSPECECENT